MSNENTKPRKLSQEKLGFIPQQERFFLGSEVCGKDRTHSGVGQPAAVPGQDLGGNAGSWGDALGRIDLHVPSY